MEPLLDLALLLFGAKVGGVAFSKLKQPSVVGELIAGIVLGPTLLSMVRPSNLVNVVSDLGLLFLVLLVSLSIDWKKLEGNTEKYSYVEIARILVTFGIVYAASAIFRLDLYTSVVLGFVMVLSSTAIVSRTLTDMKALNSHEGQSLMGIEVVDEIFAIISVALIANVMAGQAVGVVPVFTTILVVVGLFAVMGRVGFKFVSRLTGSIQRYGIEEALLGFTLLLAFLLGSITQSLNLASILGVFIAGMLLSRSAQSQVISSKVKDIGESFFIPIFFASVGLTVNLTSAWGYIGLIAALVAGVVGVKMLSAVVGLRIFRYPLGQSLKIGSGLVSMSEMTVVILALAAAKLDIAFYVSTVAAFLIINTMSPLMMSAFFSSGIGGNNLSRMRLHMYPKSQRWKAYRKVYGGRERRPS